MAPARGESGFHATFNCLWCGRPHATRSGDDLEGWAMLCSSCVAKAQDNEFLRYRLRDGLTRRTEATKQRDAQAGQLKEYYAARAAEYDDWYMRRGRYSHGVIADAAWNADLDAATLWLDALSISGEIVELAAGTGWWSTLLASKGQLWIYDAVDQPLAIAADRLRRHGLMAHVHVRDAWAEPDRKVDVVFMGFWLSHVPRARLDEFLAICRRWLKPGGQLCFIDSRRDPDSSAADHPPPADDLSLRRLEDGREFTIPKIFYAPAELVAAMHKADFVDASVFETSRFFILGHATAGG